MSITVTGFTDNTEEVLQEMRAAVARGLERCGEKAEGYAVDLCPVDTGNLRSSITHTVNDDTVYIGTNVEYGLYQEVGTGKYATLGGGNRQLAVSGSSPLSQPDRLTAPPKGRAKE